MKDFLKKYWLLCFILALPAILFPFEGRFSLGSGQHFSIGIPGIVKLRDSYSFSVDHWAGFLFLFPFWFLVCSGLLKVRLKCLSDKSWRNAFYQSLITFLYLSLIFIFGIVSTRFIWYLSLINADWKEIEQAYRFAGIIVPIACCLWPSVIFLLIYHDSLSVSLKKRIFYWIFILLFCVEVSVCALLVPASVRSIDEVIEIAVEEQEKNANKSLHRTAEPLCDLENKEKK